jgi:pterin-4a-carbinolamine dehydratase
LMTFDMKTITNLDLMMAKNMEYNYELIRDLS